MNIPAVGNISSPCNEHDRNDAAHFVFSNGYVFGNWEVVVDDSYGNHFYFSPDLVYYSDYAYCIDKRGAVYDNDQYVAETSYGIFFFKNSFHSPVLGVGVAYYVDSDGYAGGIDWNITNSYGRIFTFYPNKFSGFALRHPLVRSLHIPCSMKATLIPMLSAKVGTLQIPAG